VYKKIGPFLDFGLFLHTRFLVGAFRSVTFLLVLRVVYCTPVPCTHVSTHDSPVSLSLGSGAVSLSRGVLCRASRGLEGCARAGVGWLRVRDTSCVRVRRLNESRGGGRVALRMGTVTGPGASSVVGSGRMQVGLELGSGWARAECRLGSGCGRVRGSSARVECEGQVQTPLTRRLRWSEWLPRGQVEVAAGAVREGRRSGSRWPLSRVERALASALGA
jgi:hypothetical protein